MTSRAAFDPQGVIPACVLPFHPDLSIDEKPFRKHLRDVTSVPDLSAIAINSHASEVASCDLDEQERVLAAAMDEVGSRMPLVHGVYADGSLQAARIARMAQRGGAACLLVFPPGPLALGSQSRPEMVITHFKTIADASDLPIICFQYPLVSALGYPVDTLVQLLDAVPSIRAIKDWCNNVMQHERQIRMLQSRARPVHVLSTHSSWLYSSLVLGCHGLLSGSGSVIADLQCALFKAVQADDMKRARRLNDRIYPLAQAFYADPFADMHNRMKEALVLLGRIPCAAVRPPLVKLGAAEIARIRQALDDARVLPEGAPALAA